MHRWIVLFLLLMSGDAMAASLRTCPSGGFGTNLRSQISNLDDGGALVDVSAVFPQGIRISGANYTSIYANVNGNISFGSQYSTFTPTAIPGLNRPLIAPYFADADINPSGDVFSCIDTNNGRVIITWSNVGYFNDNADKLASFQAILTYADPQCGGIPTADIEFRYNRLQWTTGDLSGGVNGLGGTPAVAGIDAGDTINAIALPGSGTNNVMQLVNQSNANSPGVFRFRLANGTLPRCGNAAIEICETCDFGNQNDNNGTCTELCQFNVCGDGLVNIGSEQCDGDEIAPGFDQCPPGTEGFPMCNNDPGSSTFDGTCRVAAFPSGCIDINECADGLDNCHAFATCQNVLGTFACNCLPGYRDVTGDGTLCEDIDECADPLNTPCDALTQCTNTPGSFVCSACPAGYQDVNGNGTSCVDINECANIQNPVCDPLVQCINLPGTYQCSLCPAGFLDINGNGTLCEDINECADPLSPPCDALTQCTNLSGGFSCSACPLGYRDVNGDGTLCEDINECSGPSPVCDALTQCTNTPGSFTCSACPTGYRDLNGDGTLCEDIDECEESIVPLCDKLTMCVNTPGSYFCSLCPDGFIDVNGDGSLCEDINECEEDPCDPLTECTNIPSGFMCSACPEGYLDLNGDGTLCEDINECEDDPCDALALCSNTPGSFTCGACPAGYVDTNGDGTLCEDINECAGSEPVCDPTVVCNNIPGSYLCGECPQGYSDLNGDGSACEDIDECAAEVPVCDEGIGCVNLPGTYVCTGCAPGFVDNGGRCLDIDECLEPNICDVDQACTNTPGGYECGSCPEASVLLNGVCVEEVAESYLAGGCSVSNGNSQPIWMLLGLLGIVRVRRRRPQSRVA